MLALLFTGLLLGHSKPAVPAPMPVVPAISSAQAPAGGDYILVRQAYYGPTWGRYKNLATALTQACGTQSAYCESYCPKEGFGSGGKACQISYACGDHITKSTRSLSGEIIIMDCRPAVARDF